MKVLVTGGTGFIGKALVKRLVEKNYEIVVLTRNIDKARQTFPNAEIVIAQWDSGTSQNWFHFLDGDYAIINLAGESIAGLWTENKKSKILQSRLNALNSIIEAVGITKTKPRLVIHGSAVCYPFDTPQPCDESSPYGINFLAQVTRQCETAASGLKDCTRLVLIRSGIILGKGGGVLEPMLVPFKFFLGSYFGSGKQYLPWITLYDEIETILFLIEHENLEGVFNLTSPEPVQIKEFCRILAKILEKPCLFSIPSFAAKLILGQMAEELLLSGQNVIPKRLTEAGYKFKHPHIEQALAEILRKS